MGVAFGRGRGNRPRRALTAAAVAGYSPSNPGCLLARPLERLLKEVAIGLGGNFGGRPNKEEWLSFEACFCISDPEMNLKSLNSFV